MTQQRIAVDTSVAVALLVGAHTAHQAVAAWARGRNLFLSGHAAVETFSVLTRLPGDARVAPSDARLLIDENFEAVLPMSARRAASVHRKLAEYSIAGGAVYDAVIALAAHEHGAALATRDSRARSTYEAFGVEIVLLPG
ncbi:MAG TPA: PIN domain-containing protein [Lapillicoccus sp.]